MTDSEDLFRDLLESIVDRLEVAYLQRDPHQQLAMLKEAGHILKKACADMKASLPKQTPNEYYKSRYKHLRSLGECVCCSSRERPVRAVTGRARCSKCMRDASDRTIKWKERQLERERQKQIDSEAERLRGSEFAGTTDPCKGYDCQDGGYDERV